MSSKMLENLNYFLESEEGKSFIKRWHESTLREESHRKRWVDKTVSLLRSLESLDIIYNKYISHSEKRKEILFKQHIDGDTSLSGILYDAFVILGDKFISDKPFSNMGFLYKSYIVEWYLGQGSFLNVYKKID